MYCAVLQHDNGPGEHLYQCIAEMSADGSEEISVGPRWINFRELKSWGLHVVMRVPIDWKFVNRPEVLNYQTSAEELSI